MEKRKNVSMNKSVTSPLTLSMKNLGRPSQKKVTSPLSSSRALSTSSLGNLIYGNGIDAKTYTDVRSNGLSSRLARYGASSDPKSKSSQDDASSKRPTRLNFQPKSPFAQGIGKPEVKLTPIRSISLSSGRIAPPEKVTFHPNSRSQILRTGSLIVSPSLSRREDEPIAPSSDIEETPTPSVLDVLQEISRKRLNNEELDAERIKKQCKEIAAASAASNGVSSEVDGLIKYSPIMLKRGRSDGVSSANTSPTNDIQKKLRLCRNNEIFSSLSSTQVIPSSVKRTASESPKGNQPKVAHIQKTATADDIRSIPKEVPVEVVEVPAKIPEIPAKIEKPTPKLTLFNKKYDEIPRIKPTFEDESPGIKFVKPQKEIHINKEAQKKVEQNKLKVLLSCLSGELDEIDTVDTGKTEKSEPPKATEAPVVPTSAIQPIAQPSLPIVTSTQESTNQKSLFTISNSVATSTPAAPAASSATPSFSFGTNTTKSDKPAPTAEPNFTFGSKIEPSQAISPIKSTASILPTSSAPSLVSSTPMFSFGTNKPAESTAAPIVAQKPPEIKFDSTPVTTTQSTAPKPSFQFGAAGGGGGGLNAPGKVSFGVDPLKKDASVPSISFGQPNTTSSQEKPFSFGQNPVQSTTASSVSSSSSEVKPTFSFGGSTGASTGFGGVSGDKPITFGQPQQSSTAINENKPSSAPFTFGQTPVSENKSTPVAAIAPTPSFSFGQNQGNTTGIVKPTATIPSFGQNLNSNPENKPVFGGATNTTGSPSIFGSNKPSGIVNPEPAKPSIFGASSTPSSTPIFGSNTQSNDKPQASIFGSNQVSSAPSIFGSAATDKPPAFGSTPAVFGQNSNPTPNKSASIFGSSNDKPAFGTSEVKSSPFGQPQENKPAIFGQSQTGVPSFGSSNSAFGSINSTNTSNTSIFGSNAASSTGGGGFNFKLPEENKSIFNRLGDKIGDGNANNNNNNNANTSKDLFTFNSSNSTPAPTTFGGFGQTQAQAKAPEPAKPAFNFNAVASTPPNVSLEKPFVFGGSAPPSAITPSPSFNFNAGSNSAPSSNNNAAFAFGQQTPQTPSPAFNFTAQPVAPVAGGGSPMFNIGTGNSNPTGQRRPIRTAVRRR